jgi:ABC-2 type transport system permease protein
MDWSQLSTILWLRWRLSRNQWSRGGTLNAFLTMIAVGVGLAIGAAGGLVGVIAGALALAKTTPQVMLIVWDGIVVAFLFFWMIGIVSELQRSETIDISRMLHLPVSLREIFLVNYVASHLTLSIILFLPAMLGLCLGLIFGRQWTMVCMFPLVLGFVFMITAWTYCLRGWLATLMVNKRRRRAIIAGITFTFVLLSQLPNLLGNFVFDHRRHRPRPVITAPQEGQTPVRPADGDKMRLPSAVLEAHKYVPFLWVGNGAMSLAQGQIWPAVLGTAGAIGIGGLGLRRAYRTTMRFYQGQAAGTKAVRKERVTKATAVRESLLDRRLPGVPDEAAAAALAFFRSMMRAPEVKMALAMNFLMLLIFGAMILLRRSAALGDPAKPFILTGAMIFIHLGMSHLMFNQFGFDRNGFRQLVLLPTPRKWILMGKNLAFAPLALAMGLTVLVLAGLALRISVMVFLAGALQLVVTFLIVSMAGNLLSILVPHHVAAGSLKRTKTSSTTALLIFMTRMLFPAVMIPLFIPPALGLLLSHVGWLPAGPVNLLVSAVLLVLIALLYWFSLAPCGELLQQREKKILQVVTQEVE